MSNALLFCHLQQDSQHQPMEVPRHQLQRPPASSSERQPRHQFREAALQLIQREGPTAAPASFSERDRSASISERATGSSENVSRYKKNQKFQFTTHISLIHSVKFLAKAIQGVATLSKKRRNFVQKLLDARAAQCDARAKGTAHVACIQKFLDKNFTTVQPLPKC